MFVKRSSGHDLEGKVKKRSPFVRGDGRKVDGGEVW